MDLVRQGIVMGWIGILLIIGPSLSFQSVTNLSTLSGLQLMSRLGFKCFTKHVHYCSLNTPMKSLNFDQIVPEEEFQLIKRLIENDTNFSRREIIYLADIANYREATGLIAYKIAQYFIKGLCRERDEMTEEGEEEDWMEIPKYFAGMPFWNEIIKNCNEENNLSVEFNNESILLSGLTISPYTKRPNLLLIANVSHLYAQLTFKHLVFDMEDMKLLQTMMHQDLKGIHFEDCIFHCEIKFNFSQLIRLIRFNWIQCIGDSILDFLLGLPNSLIQLNISKCHSYSNELLIKVLKKHYLLELLDISGSFLENTNAELFTQIISMSNLKIVKLSDISYVNPLMRQISRINQPLIWNHLSFGSLYSTEIIYWLFLRNASKFPNLAYLDWECHLPEHIDHLKSILLHLPSLKELDLRIGGTEVINRFQPNLNELFSSLEVLNRKLILSTNEYINPTTLFQLYHLSSLDLSSHFQFDIPIDNLNVKRLKIDQLCIRKNINKFNLVADRISQLVEVHLSLYLQIEPETDEEFKFLSKLFANNGSSIEELTLSIGSSFISYPELVELLVKCRSLKKLELIVDQDDWKIGKLFFLLSKTKALESIEWMRFSASKNFILITTFLSYNNLPNLKSFSFHFNWNRRIKKRIGQFNTVKFLIISCDGKNSRFISRNLSVLLNSFPNVSTLKIHAYEHPLTLSLTPLHCLTELTVFCKEVLNLNEVKKEIIQLPFLNQLSIDSRKTKLFVTKKKDGITISQRDLE